MALKYNLKRPLDPSLGIRVPLLQTLPRTPRLAFNAKTPTAARAWQVKARRRFQECLGNAPPRVPLKSRVLEKIQLDGYTRTTFTLTTAPHIKAIAWLCVPDSVAISRVPAVIAVPGHGIGAKDILAMDAAGKPRKEGDGYAKDYALQAVRLGYPTLVIEPLGFGERRDAEQMGPKSYESGCHASANLALMLGTTLARLRINDIQRGIDHLQTLPFIDPDRIALMGISGGGQLTLWTAAIEPRIKVAVVSGYLNSFRDSIMGVHHCTCNFVPGLASELDMTDLAALVAPRPLMIEGGTTDPIFPVKATRAAIRTTRKSYRVFGAEDRVESEIFKGGHQWSGRKLEAFFERWL